MVGNFFAIHRLSSPSVASTANNLNSPILTATETVAARVSTSGPDFDTHNCYNHGKQTYTIPVTGIYQVSTSINGQINVQAISKNAGDVININNIWDMYVAGDWFLSLDNNCIVEYDGKDTTTVIEAENFSLVGKVLPIDFRRVVKIPVGSTLKSVQVLYGQK